MMISDTIGDILIRIKNAYMAGKGQLTAPFSKQKELVLKVLKKQTIIETYKTSEKDGKKDFIITLCAAPKYRYIEVTRRSTPGRRVYIKAKEIYKVKGGRGFLIMSTPQGIMDGAEAREKKLGGELMAEIFV